LGNLSQEFQHHFLSFFHTIIPGSKRMSSNT
jgi:hypothetical protein